MACASAEAGKVEKAAESLIFQTRFPGPIDHVIANIALRDAPMRATACPETDLPRK